MKNTAYLITAAAILGMFCGCDKKTPVNLWDTRPMGNANPVIGGIVPANRALAGVFNIVIQGQHFGPTAAQNAVYFGTTKVEIISADTNQITVYRPNLTGEGITVKVVVQNAAEIDTMANYAIDAVTVPHGTFSPNDIFQVMTADQNGNVYIAMSNKDIKKVAPDGTTTLHGSWSGIPAVSSISDMRVGPNGNLYLQASKAKKFLMVPPGGTCTQLFSFVDNLSYFDFDENGNVFAGGTKKNLNLVPAGSTTAQQLTAADYTKYDITCVRVYNKKVYVFALASDATGTTGIYSHDITSATGAVGTGQLVRPWSTISSPYDTTRVRDMTFSAEGDLYLATNYAANPILVVSASGQQTPLYKGILGIKGAKNLSADEIAWSGTTLYQSYQYSKTVSSIVYGLNQISVGETGAPYYGRP